MATVTTTPGVYIEEDATPSLSVNQNATAVPVFIGRFTPNDTAINNTVVRINSWLDFTNKFATQFPLSVSVTISQAPSTLKKNNKVIDDDIGSGFQLDAINFSYSTASSALNLYFQNGGGPCYIFPLSSTADATALAQIPNLIEEYEDITLLCTPENSFDYQDTVNQQLLTLLNKNKGYFLLTDNRYGTADATLGSSPHIAAYYPLLKIAKPAPENIDDSLVIVNGYDTAATTLAAIKSDDSALGDAISKNVMAQYAAEVFTVRTSAVMAGIYGKNDAERGVWKAPANYVINGVSDVSARISNEEQGIMNQAGINAIRYFSGRGLVVWGARTLQDDDNWRYIPVRRLFDAAERDIKNALRTMVFEPNNQPTWTRVRAAIDHYLYRLWQQGGLAGNKPEEAYFVNIGKDITMSDDDIDQGKMIVKIGLAAVRPAEFIILQFTQNVSQ